MIRLAPDSGNGGATPTAPGARLLSAHGIVKRFGTILANDVDAFEVRSGEIHALLGENGAGKSTLSKILYGFYRPDAGEIRVGDEPVAMESPAAARACGIGMVFQDFTLIPALSVLENIVLFMRDVPQVLNRRELAARIAETAARLQISTPLARPVWALAVGERQKVEILKQIMAGARVLILDEPTKVLPPQERGALFGLLGELRGQGFGIVFITHKLDEVMAIADRISVMRGGRVVGVFERAAASETALMALMFESRESQAPARARERQPGALAVELRGVSTPGDSVHAVALRDVSLALRAGEIVGVAGVTGSGQRELGDLVIGRTQPVRGQKLLWGEDAGAWGVGRTRETGVALVPESPLDTGCIVELSLAENFALGSPLYHRGLGTDWVKVRADLIANYAELGFPPPATESRLRVLSGGNVQRAVMVRELSRQPRLIVALYPTRGLDAHSAAAVRDILAARAATGAAVLLISEDLDELFAASDRVAVLYQGALSGEFAPADFKYETVGAAMVGAGMHRHVA